MGGTSACSGDDDAGGAGPTVEPLQSDRVLVVMANSAASLESGKPGRLPLGVGDASGALITDAPDTLTFRIEDIDGVQVGDDIEVARRDVGLPRAYYPLLFTVPAVGFYTARSEVDGEPVDAAFEVPGRGSIEIPVPGEPLPPVATPTVDDARGVDPICTNDPPCGLHAVDLESVLGTGPVAVLVSTPAFCQTGICGPVLDLLLAAQDAHPDVTFIHVEVYASAAEVEAAGPEAALAPAVKAWKLPFEPALFLVGADGALAERLDVIYDSGELDEALTRLTA